MGANGRIVCANCHLAQKPVELEVPQVLRNGKSGDLNVGAVLILPEGFQLAPQERISSDIQEKVGKLYFQPYSAEQKNILVIGPVPGKKYQEIVFPIVSPV